MIEKITNDEIGIVNWQREYAESEQMKEPMERDARKILKVWESAKKDLYALFGEELILSKTFYYVADQKIVMDEFKQKLYDDEDSAIYKFRVALKRAIDWNELCELNDGKVGAIISELYYSPFSYCLREQSLYDNSASCPEGLVIKGQLPNEVDVQFCKGSKVIKVLGKYAKAYNLEAEFEAFRIEHSQILNQKKISGELCLSIHPLDYITMSDNSNRWCSCMSWQEYGEFRGGTVEMMNSPVVIVAYLKDEHIDYHYWNSKKWRELFIVNESLIAGVKGYPYQNAEFEKEVIEWLRDLAFKNCDWTYHDPEWVEVNGGDEACDSRGNTYRFDTGWAMYNDFRARNEEHTHLIAVKSGSRSRHFAIQYSGERQCMWCGKLNQDFSDEGMLACDECAIEPMYCADCGMKIYDSDEYYELGGNYYCADCYCAVRTTDIFTGNEVSKYDKTDIFLAPSWAIDNERLRAIIGRECPYRLPVYVNFSMFELRNLEETKAWEELCGLQRTKELRVNDWNSHFFLTLDLIPDALFEQEGIDFTREDIDDWMVHHLF